MSRLKKLREQQNLTQIELSEKAKISVRTIQRIEAGTKPKGNSLRALSRALNVSQDVLIYKNNTDVEREEIHKINYDDRIESKIKLVNLSSIIFVLIPPLNVLIPLLIVLVFKLKNPTTKQIISLQIMWTIMAPIIFFLGILLKLGNNFTILIMVLIVLTNVYFTLRNAIELDKNKKLFYKLTFSFI